MNEDREAKRLEVEERVNVSFELKSDDEGFNSVREIIDQAMNAALDKLNGGKS